MAGEYLLKILIMTIISLGGVGTIIIGIIRFTAETVTKRIEQKYEARLNKELENYKKLLGEKTYVTKVRFDTEFQVLKDNNKALFEAYNAVKSYTIGLKQSLDVGDSSVFLDLYKSTNLSCVHYLATLQTTVEINAVFIAPQIYNQYKELLLLCGAQFRHFDDCFGEIVAGKELLAFTTDLDRIEKVNNDVDMTLNKLNERIRKYLDSLVVIG